MTTNIPQGTLLDVLKKKMRQTKEEMEKYKDECEEFQKRLQGEILRREDVSYLPYISPMGSLYRILLPTLELRKKKKIVLGSS